MVSVPALDGIDACLARPRVRDRMIAGDLPGRIARGLAHLACAWCEKTSKTRDEGSSSKRLGTSFGGLIQLAPVRASQSSSSAKA
jgi:hypothetical protein